VNFLYLYSFLLRERWKNWN